VNVAAPAAPTTPITCRYVPDVDTDPADNTVAADVDEPFAETSTGEAVSTPVYADTDTAIPRVAASGIEIEQR
jgi:hypothetical protein